MQNVLVLKSFGQNFNRNFIRPNSTYLDCHGKFCNFLIVIQIISPNQLWWVGGGDKLQFLDFWGKSLIFKVSSYKEKNTKLKLDMTTAKQQFYSNALFYNQLQNILDFYQNNTQIWRVTMMSFWSNS